MADGNAQILRQLGLNWLECQDEQGVFYFNQATQQSSDMLPAELQTAGAGAAVAAPTIVAAPAAVPAAPAKAKVISGGMYSLPQVQQQTFMPQQVQVMQQQVTYPRQMQAQQPTVIASYTPVQQAQPQVVASYTPVQAPVIAQPVPAQVVTAQVAETAPAQQKIAFGDWAVYQDELGTFYMQISTGQQFETPPPELMQAYQQYRAEQDQIHAQALQQIELQKRQIDQQLADQTQSLRMTYGA